MPLPGGFAHATELIEYLERRTTQVDIGGACYPEKHPESTDADEDLRWTRAQGRARARSS